MKGLPRYRLTRRADLPAMPEIEAVLSESARRQGLDSASCTLPTGEVVEVTKRRTPLYDMARELDARGYGDYRLQAYTPTGTPGLRGLVSVMAGLTVSERDKEGLRLEKYRPFPSRGRPAERDPGSESIPALRMIEGGLSLQSTAAA
jgi:hypothetical protein